MNQFRAWLYGHDSKMPRPELESTHGLSFPDVNQADGSLNKDKTPDPELRQLNSNKEDVTIRSAVLRVIPLAPGDCLECKLVGSGVMMLSGVIVLASAMSRCNNPNKVQLSGARKNLYLALCTGLFCAFESAAACRLLDRGPFSKSPEHQDR